MAGIQGAITTAEIATGTSAKTLMQVIAATNQRVKVGEISIAFKGTTSTNAPILVKVAKQTTAGTVAGSLTPVKVDSTADETLQTTAAYGASSEPTTTDVYISELVHPQTGYTWQAPFGKELIIPGGGRLGIIVTAANDVNAVCRVFYEE